jgi:hypothetical protein
VNLFERVGKIFIFYGWSMSFFRTKQPRSTLAVGRWLAYEAYFTPAVMAHLTPWIARFGY